MVLDFRVSEPISTSSDEKSHVLVLKKMIAFFAHLIIMPKEIKVTDTIHKKLELL